MLVGEIMVTVAAMCIVIAFAVVIRTERLKQHLRIQLSSISRMREETESHLSRARHLAEMSAIDQLYAVCDSCQRIISRYIRDENGVTCIECAEKHSER